MRKTSVITPLGMNRDLAESKFDARFTYENRNLRLITDRATSKFVMTNERGPERIDVWFYDRRNEEWRVGDIYGTVIGVGVIDRHLALFTHGRFKVIDPDTQEVTYLNRDRIYRIDFEEEPADGIKVKGYELFKGDLGFDLSHPIETLPFYESEDIKKVYWTDGVNQPRMINLMADFDGYNAKSFDFAQEISGSETMAVERIDNTNGLFPSGTVQYAFTYFNRYGQESCVACVSPLYFISDDNRGSSPDETVACSFKITIDGLKKDFDGVRVYSIIRTSENAMPVVKRIADLGIEARTEYVNGVMREATYGGTSFTDNNTRGEDVESAYLLYVGAKDITCETITEKDNTAFYGNISVKNKKISDALKEKLRLGKQVGGAFTALGYRNNKQLAMPPTSGKYNWESQLRQSADDIRFFQYRETYRFGVQLQDRFGNWSDVVRVESDDSLHGHDFVEDLMPESDVSDSFSYGEDVIATAHDDLKRRCATFGGTINLSALGSMLDGYIAIRPVVVYPRREDRSVLAQGILTPTVYNLEDRVNNGTYGQMSWFSRPICPPEVLFPNLGNFNRGALEFRHYHPLPPTNQYMFPGEQDNMYKSNAELVSNFDGYKINGNEVTKTIDYTFWANVYPWQEKELADINLSKRDRATQLRSEFFVDQSLETFHSPEVEYLDMFAKMDMDGVKMRIVGLAPVSYHSEGVYMAAESIADSDRLQTPTRDFKTGGGPETGEAFKQISEFDGIKADYDYEELPFDEDRKAKFEGYNKVYPWHTKTLTHEITDSYSSENGNIIDTAFIINKALRSWFKGRSKSTLQKKIYDTIRYSYDTLYFENALSQQIDKPTYFNTVDGGVLNVEVDGERKLFDFNVDKTVVPNTRVASTDRPGQYRNDFVVPSSGRLKVDDNAGYGSTGIATHEAVWMRYRSTSALVLHLSSTVNPLDNKRMSCALPRYGNSNVNIVGSYQYGTPREQSIDIRWADNSLAPLTTRQLDMANKSFMWDSDLTGMYQNIIYDDVVRIQALLNRGYGFFYVGELYRDDADIHNRFGGESEEAIASNVWVPCGNPVRLRDASGSMLQNIDIEWTRGDTYYQRYDNLHTYPYAEEDVNQIVDIVSFMCETRVNIDGRYDRNRGLEENDSTRPVNSNRLNTVYGQVPSYFQYRSLDSKRLEPSEFPMTVAWSKIKNLGEITDVFTNITLANSIDLDGSKGEIRALRRHFDDILAFQDTGISRIIFNQQQAVQTEAGVPLEIANSGKVTGRQYLTQTVGCHNKWSIASSPSGTYFMDDAHKDIFVLGSDHGLRSVAVEKGFRSWVRNTADMSRRWDVSRWTNVRTLYDKNNSELMFVTLADALSYNEQLGQFTSFYDYGRTPWLETVKNHNVLMRSEGGGVLYEDIQPRTYLYEHNAGRYNDFFGVYRPFYTELLCHSDGSDRDSSLMDKTWTNVSFQFDTFDDTETDVKARYKEGEHFDNVTCETEYQRGETDWRYRYPGIKKTFRIWHADLPRDGYTFSHQGQTADRFRNPWLRMRLTKDSNINRNWRSVLHSVTIGYLE